MFVLKEQSFISVADLPAGHPLCPRPTTIPTTYYDCFLDDDDNNYDYDSDRNDHYSPMTGPTTCTTNSHPASSRLLLASVRSLHGDNVDLTDCPTNEAAHHPPSISHILSASHTHALEVMPAPMRC